jgi:hypothetical protein
MRIFGFEITKIPKPSGRDLLWNRSTYHENGRQIDAMTPEELRTELKWVLEGIHDGQGLLTLYIAEGDVYKRIRSANRY